MSVGPKVRGRRRADPATPLRRLADADDVLLIGEIASLYHVGESTIRKQLAARTFIPKPFDMFPFRWLKVDVQADLDARRTVAAADGATAPRRRLRRRRRRAPASPDAAGAPSSHD